MWEFVFCLLLNFLWKNLNICEHTHTCISIMNSHASPSFNNSLDRERYFKVVGMSLDGISLQIFSCPFTHVSSLTWSLK